MIKQTKKPRWSTPSARKERQKYTSDTYRSKYNKIKWSIDKTKKDTSNGINNQ